MNRNITKGKIIAYDAVNKFFSFYNLLKTRGSDLSLVPALLTALTVTADTPQAGTVVVILDTVASTVMTLLNTPVTDIMKLVMGGWRQSVETAG